MQSASLYCASCGAGFEAFGSAEQLATACCRVCSSLLEELGRAPSTFPEEDGFDTDLLMTMTGSPYAEMEEHWRRREELMRRSVGPARAH